MRKAHLIVCGWWLATCAYAPGRQAVAQNELTDSVKLTLDQLGSIKAKALDPSIPSAVRPLLTELKHELRDLIAQTMNDPTVHCNTPDELTSQVLSALRNRGIIRDFCENRRDFGRSQERDENETTRVISGFERDFNP